MNSESLKQLSWKSLQLIALQLQRSEFPETVEEAVGQSGEPVATQVQLQQAPLEGIIPIVPIQIPLIPIVPRRVNITLKDILIQIRQQIPLQVQLFQAGQPLEGSVAKAPKLVAFQP